jgi:hypothetical protein
MAFRSLKYTYVGRKVLEGDQCGPGSGTLSFSLQNCDLRTCAPQIFSDLLLRNEPKNLQICDLRTNKKICVPTFEEEFT